jgi:serine/threonine protein kinase
VGRHKVTVIRELAEGGFGKVLLVKDCDSGRDYAMKQMLCQAISLIQTSIFSLFLKSTNKQ